MKVDQQLVGYAMTLLCLMSSCSTNTPNQSNTFPVSHETFSSLLSKHVDEDGFVDYQGFNQDRNQLKAYLKLITENAPNDINWSDDDQIAYWINLYNAFTIELILEHYPVQSIKDIGSAIQVPFVNTPWDIKFIVIGKETYDLNNIEHGILREKWNEPRIHFAVNCASYSCPKLRKEAYEGTKLNLQLEEQASAFINDERFNKISEDKAILSRLFFWYKGDFNKSTSLREFINQYSEVKVSEQTEIEHLDYNWDLNELVK